MDTTRYILVTFVLAFYFTYVSAESCDFDDEVSLEEIRNDICYFRRKKETNFWATSHYRRILEEASRNFFYEDGELLCDEKINEKCEKYPKSLLNPRTNSIHYEVCHYAKYGLWSHRSNNTTESKERLRLLEKFVMLGTERINHKQTEVLCSNYANMSCPQCPDLAEQMCYFVVHGNWKAKPPSTIDQDKFFKIGNRSIDWQEIWNKCDTQFTGKECNIEDVHYPVSQAPSTVETSYCKDCCEKCSQGGDEAELSLSISEASSKRRIETQDVPASTPSTPELARTPAYCNDCDCTNQPNGCAPSKQSVVNSASNPGLTHLKEFMNIARDFLFSGQLP